IERIHLHVVEQLDPRDRNARLDRLDHRIDGSLERWEGADGGGDRFWYPIEPKRDLRDDAKRALGTDEDARQIIAGGRLARPAAGADDPSVGQHDGQT